MIGHGNDAHGVLIIDKPAGPTSHDIVANLRRTLGTRAVGHAGTLDPAATGVLVVAVGEATKLVAYLVLATKRYEATIQFGASTATDDRDGDLVAQAPLPPDLALALATGDSAGLLDRALERERMRREQTPPQFSAIKHNGRPAYQLARRGEFVELARRPIEVHELVVTATGAHSVDVSLHVSKGYYVRALARDIGESLNVPAHLSALRRVASGPFTLSESLPFPASADELMRRGQSLAGAARRVFAACELTSEGTRRAGHGQSLSAAHFVSPPAAGLSAWFDPLGRLVALGRDREPDQFAALRVFGHLTSSSEM